MLDTTKRRTPVLGIVAIATSLAMVCVIYWITKPGVAKFNAFNESVFGHFYTAGAIAMVLFYGFAFVAFVILPIGAVVFAWIRNESPRWLTWAATIAALIAPIVSVNLLKST